MSDPATKLMIDELAACLDIPESAYEKSEARYKDVAEWFARDEAHCAPYSPHIYPQGSFRLGTVVRADEYDLDFGCRLRTGISKATHTQEQLKSLVGQDLAEYRAARGIAQRLEEKHRCWRLKYKDDLPFHMDGVPSIPEEPQQRLLLENAMVTHGADRALAQRAAQYAGSITDNRMPNYKQVSAFWRISNSEGYAQWFESRMRLAPLALAESARRAKVAKIDDLPARLWKSPLQRSVQILKCHRDRMFADSPGSKPISIIITTLAGHAYQGEQALDEALDGILSRMGDLVGREKPRVPNPVNPVEDFADKWYGAEYRALNLEKNFWEWLEQAKIDFDVLKSSRDPGFVVEQAMAKFGAELDVRRLESRFAIAAPTVITQPKTHTITDVPAKPWLGA